MIAGALDAQLGALGGGKVQPWQSPAVTEPATDTVVGPVEPPLLPELDDDDEDVVASCSAMTLASLTGVDPLPEPPLPPPLLPVPPLLFAPLDPPLPLKGSAVGAPHPGKARSEAAATATVAMLLTNLTPMHALIAKPPRVAQLLPIPRRFNEKGIRRVGFHGLSYAFLMQELERVAGTDVSRGRIDVLPEGPIL